MSEIKLSKEQLVEQFLALKLPEAVELVELLEEKLGIPKGGCFAAGVASSAVGDEEGSGSAAKAEKSEFRVKLNSFDPKKKIAVLKVVKEKLGLALLEAKKAVEELPFEFPALMPKIDAEALKKLLVDEGGADVSLE